ncbi:aminomethyl-transferring glycine dehydrogenase subunit GcvPA [Thiohalorhabdus methylotrophus]|uniref:Probable glycine dehydrogenase (decarboxylating) subunit 1 n=1 Tax=Thiohalorhabdus methylotrophus TaxID=3242694 RepID=A0ABV4TVW0_9GAMM
MPFIPHTEAEAREMLDTLGLSSMEELFAEIPECIRAKPLEKVPEGLSEMELMRLMRERAAQDESGLRSFVGAGAYEHHIPSAVWELATRGEYYSAYTPYQAEASQGTLQTIYEFQTMIAGLTGMEVANASLYDGGTALAEAVLMAVRAHKGKSQKVLVPESVHPAYLRVARTFCGAQGVTLESVPFQEASGTVDPERLGGDDNEYAALVVPQPNFFGRLEAVEELAAWAKARGALVIAVVNPTALALLTPPAEWGADIAVGEGQPLGLPMSSGGPYLGLMATTKKLVRQMPGRLVARTVDTDGKEGFSLTLQAREQHIRRAKAKSNICTNQGLAMTAATIYMSLVGEEGLKQVAGMSHTNTRRLVEKLTAIDGVERRFDGPFFHEAALRLPRPAAEVGGALLDRGVLGGFDLGREYSDLGDTLLVCATETKTEADLDAFTEALAEVL